MRTQTASNIRIGTRADPADTIWNPRLETMPRAQLRALQGDLLRERVRQVFERAPLFRSRYQAAGVEPRDIRTIDDLARLPMVSKADVRSWARERGDIFGGTACVPPSELYLVNHSTGTSGLPTVYGLTTGDLESVAEIFARALWCIGLRPGDRTPVSGHGLWHGWIIGFELGLRALGGVPYRIAFHTLSGVETIFSSWTGADFTALRTFVPEVERGFLEARGIVPREVFPNARFVYAGIDATQPKRQLIERLFGMPFKNTLGSGDQYLIGGECEHAPMAYHMPEDFFAFEVLDPASGEPVPPGGVGELVLTNLWAEGFPYLRYRLEDIATYQTDPCACGRTTMRLQVLGRLSWSVDVQGVRIFSSQVEDVVWRTPELLAAKYQLVRRRTQPQAVLEVNVGPPTALPNADRLCENVQADLTARFGVPSRVTILDPNRFGFQGVKMERVVEID